MSCLCLAAFLMASRTWKVHAAALADADELQWRIPEEVRRDRNHYNSSSSDDDEARGEKITVWRLTQHSDDARGGEGFSAGVTWGESGFFF